MSVVKLDSVTFQHPARIASATVNGCSTSPAGGAPCKILLDLETRMVHITHLLSKKESLVPLENVSSMIAEPLKK